MHTCMYIHITTIISLLKRQENIVRPGIIIFITTLITFSISAQLDILSKNSHSSPLIVTNLDRARSFNSIIPPEEIEKEIRAHLFIQSALPRGISAREEKELHRRQLIHASLATNHGRCLKNPKKKATKAGGKKRLLSGGGET